MNEKEYCEHNLCGNNNNNNNLLDNFDGPYGSIYVIINLTNILSQTYKMNEI